MTRVDRIEREIADMKQQMQPPTEQPGTPAKRSGYGGLIGAFIIGILLGLLLGYLLLA